MQRSINHRINAHPETVQPPKRRRLPQRTCLRSLHQRFHSIPPLAVLLLVVSCSGNGDLAFDDANPISSGAQSPGAQGPDAQGPGAPMPSVGSDGPFQAGVSPTLSMPDVPPVSTTNGSGVPSSTAEPVGPAAPSGPSDSQVPSGSDSCESTAEVGVGLSKMRRLTRTQLNNTLRDLLGVPGEPASVLVPDERIGPFDSNSIAPVTNLIVQQHQEVAQRVAQDAVARRAEIAGCDLTSPACPAEFVERFGLRAFRRPLDEAERSGLMALYELGSASGGPEQGFRLVLQAVLQAPSFLYLTDTGADGIAASSPTPVSPYSLASRLAYFLWNTLPDDELFARAADASLATEPELRAQVERMLADPRAADTIALFHIQLLRLDHLLHAEKDLDVFPEFDAELADAMLQEAAAFTSNVILVGDGRLNTLLTASFTYPQGELLDLYGVAPPSGFTPGDRVELSPTERSGLLTQPAFLASHAKRNATSPVHRGIIIRENLLCQTIPPPPNNVSTVLPPATDATTTRERFAQHLADPTCAGCHTLMDPIGLSFENYDGIGKYRTTEGVHPVDASGAIVGGGEDLTAEYANAVEMTKLLGNAQSVRDCVARQWFRFALGRTESQADTCSVAAVREGFATSDGNVPALLEEIVLSDAFRHVRSTATEEISQ